MSKYKNQMAVIRATATLTAVNELVEKATEQEQQTGKKLDAVTKTAIDQLNTEVKRFVSLYSRTQFCWQLTQNGRTGNYLLIKKKQGYDRRRKKAI